jgi:hypothetical protein
MASEVALAQVQELASDAVVVDPLAGSGTVVRVAADSGRPAFGFDLDPLAVLMARVWTTPVDSAALPEAAASLVGHLAHTGGDLPVVPWIDGDPETKGFVDYWFAPAQQAELRGLSLALGPLNGPIADALRIALSRTIITKDRGASLARDVSHSRPHRVRPTNDFSVGREFVRWARWLAQRLAQQPPPDRARVDLGDARQLDQVGDGSVDAVITSPPYLNAIDYLRGHRLTLVWLGYRIGDLRAVRARSVGAEAGPRPGEANLQLAGELRQPFGGLAALPPAESRMVDRYVLDLYRVLTELHRILRPNGTAVLVVGNSSIRGVFLNNAAAVMGVAGRLGFTLESASERALPANRRYLPPPAARAPSDLEKRMRSETVLKFRRLAGANPPSAG